MGESAELDAEDVQDLLCDFIGRSAALQNLKSQVCALATSDANVFVSGAPGTGKKLAARAIHSHSHRASGPFVLVNCAAGSDGDQVQRIFAPQSGALARAQGGTLVLDNILDLQGKSQGRLLEFLCAQGGDKSDGHADAPVDVRPFDVRIICISNKDPAVALAENWRADLFYRLAVLSLSTPPLADRQEDIPLLAQHVLTELAALEQTPFTGFEANAMATLVAQTWPGNIHQLRNVLHRVVVLHDGPVVSADMLKAAEPANADGISGGQSPITTSSSRTKPEVLGTTLADIERWAIEETIKLSNGSLPRAARILDVAPSTLYRKRETWLKNSQASPDR